MTVWIGRAVVLAVHEEQLGEHGGASGLRDDGLLNSALARPLNAASYAVPDIFELAASYAFGLIKNHPFIDGNKRVSLVITELFLELNGYALTANDAECLNQWLALSSGGLAEGTLANWLRENCDPIG